MNKPCEKVVTICNSDLDCQSCSPLRSIINNMYCVITAKWLASNTLKMTFRSSLYIRYTTEIREGHKIVISTSTFKVNRQGQVTNL